MPFSMLAQIVRRLNIVEDNDQTFSVTGKPYESVEDLHW
jgi:hypothetical protein